MHHPSHQGQRRDIDTSEKRGINMSDIELVISLPEEAYKLLKNEGVDWLGAEHILNAVANGILLPKGHGKLKDIDKFLKRVEEDRAHECYLHSWTIDDVLQKLDSWYAPTIIEADPESEV